MSKQKKQADNSVKVALITSVSAVVVALISTILAPVALKSLQNRETPSPTMDPQASPPTAVVPTPDAALAIFDLVNANMHSFFTTENASFDLVSNNGNILEVTSNWYELVYIDQELPEDFTAYIRFVLQDFSNEFIVGIGDGRNWQHTYAVSVTPWDISLDKRNTGDRMFERLFTTQQESKYKIEKDKPVILQFKRFNKSLVFLVNGVKVIEVDRSMDAEINQYNYLFLSSEGDDQPGTFTVDRLIIAP